jgi:trimethylamine--corrinoid protein Co-methyltransferase
MDCARSGIPATLISMPLGGATAPVTLREMVVQHCAESLSGVLIHQLAAPGAPLIWGGAPSVFDMRHGTTPLAAVETGMVNVGDAQVGRHLGLPTHGYLGLSDAKVVDHQAGWETSQGLVMAALAGINLVAGPGMLGFVGCQSPEKLLLDDQAAGAALRLIEGVSGRSADQATSLLADVAEQGDFLGHKHTRRSFRKELLIPKRLVDRAPEPAWRAAGALDGWGAARAEVARIVERGNPVPLEEGLAAELKRLVLADAARLGVELALG